MIKKNKYIIHSKTMNSKILYFSDLHYGFGTDIKTLNELEEIIACEAPDIIFFGGDLLSSNKINQTKQTDLITFLSKLNPKSGKYAVYGNHDSDGSNKPNLVRQLLESADFKILSNSEHIIKIKSATIKLVGFNNVTYNLHNLSAISKKPADHTLFFVHEGDLYDELVNYHFDLCLSGHTHGGQIYIPLLVKLILPEHGRKYIKGKFDRLIVSNGIGKSRLPIRLVSKPSVEIIEIKNM